MWSILPPLARLFEKRKTRIRDKQRVKDMESALSETKEQMAVEEADFKTAKAQLDKVLTDVSIANQKLKDLEQKIKTLNSQKLDSEDNFKAKTESRQIASDNLLECQTKVSSAIDKLNDLDADLSKTVADDFKGPEKKTLSVNEYDDATDSLHIHALGDLHGWAPGLISYLTHHNLAKIEISGVKVYEDSADGRISLNVDAMHRLFPDLQEHIADFNERGTDADETLESFHHAGLLGQRAGYVNPKANFCQIDAEWIGENKYFVQVGDIFDRADHSELAAEIFRQLLIQAPAHIFVLVGNHEEFLLLNQWNGWHRNEKKWDYSPKRGGNTRSLALINPEFTDAQLLEDMYEKYRQSAAMLYFTQFFAKRKVAKNGHWDIPALSEEELESYSDKILSGGWSGYEAAGTLHGTILHHSKKGSTRFPGAIAGLGIGNTWFMHGEPNGLKKYFSNLDGTSIDLLKDPINIGGRDMIILEMDVIGEDGGYNSGCTELFWARDAHDGFDALNSKFANITESIINIIPGVRNIVHGHSPVPNVLGENKPHTYLGRILGKEVSPGSGEIRVYNIDEGITPVYQISMPNQEKMQYCPTGLQVPSVLEEIHTSGELVKEDDLWDLSHMYIEKDSSPFTISLDLTLNETPPQYLKVGPGQIKVNPENYDEPEFTCTSEDNFRKNPLQYSWLHIDKVDKLTNPNKLKNPPDDKLYRVQHGGQGVLTLAQNILKMLELEAFIRSSYSGVESKEYIKQIRTENYLPPHDHGILGEAYECSVRFMSIRSTTSPNIFNLSFLNMRESSVKLILENNRMQPGSEKDENKCINEYNIKAGSYLTISYKAINPASPIRISIDDGEQPTRELFEGIFDLGKDAPLDAQNKCKPPTVLSSLIKAENNDMPIFKLTNEEREGFLQKKQKQTESDLLDSKTLREGAPPLPPVHPDDDGKKGASKPPVPDKAGQVEKPADVVLKEKPTGSEALDSLTHMGDTPPLPPADFIVTGKAMGEDLSENVKKILATPDSDKSGSVDNPAAVAPGENANTGAEAEAEAERTRAKAAEKMEGATEKLKSLRMKGEKEEKKD